MQTDRLVSVVIVNYNSAQFLDECLKSVRSQTYALIEIIAVDNNSQDGSQEVLSRYAEGITVVVNSDNLGYCGGANQGIGLAVGEYVLILNPDIILDRFFVEIAVKRMRMDLHTGGLSGKILQLGSTENRNIIDSTGIYLDYFYRCYDHGQCMEDDGSFDSPALILAACGCAPFYRKTMLEDIAVDGQIFDESFFAYYDDVDLGWRSALAGWKIVYEPRGVVYHYRQGRNTIRHRHDRKPDVFAQILTIKNRYLLLIKNEDFFRFIILLPAFFVYELLRFTYILIKFPAALKGYRDAIMALPHAFRMRRLTQKKRTVPSGTLWTFFRMRQRLRK